MSQGYALSWLNNISAFYETSLYTPVVYIRTCNRYVYIYAPYNPFERSLPIIVWVCPCVYCVAFVKAFLVQNATNTQKGSDKHMFWDRTCVCLYQDSFKIECISHFPKYTQCIYLTVLISMISLPTPCETSPVAMRLYNMYVRCLINYLFVQCLVFVLYNVVGFNTPLRRRVWIKVYMRLRHWHLSISVFYTYVYICLCVCSVNLCSVWYSLIRPYTEEVTYCAHEVKTLAFSINTSVLYVCVYMPVCVLCLINLCSVWYSKWLGLIRPYTEEYGLSHLLCAWG